MLVESGGDWINNPGSNGGFDCGKILISDFHSNPAGTIYRIALSIPHSDGQSCPNLSADAIKIGRYSLLKGDTFTEPGEAAFLLNTDSNMYVSYGFALTQDSGAYFEVTSIEDIPKGPSWPKRTYYKRVTGKINCKIQDLALVEDPIEIKDLNFSVFMMY